MNNNKVILFLNTIKFLKFKQILYRVYYQIKKIISIEFNFEKQEINFLKINKQNLLYNENFFYSSECVKFYFLNKEHEFKKIDWDFNEYGELWNFNLHYFNFLNYDKTSKDVGLNLINNFIENCSHKNRFRSYPISLRTVNWIKFLSFYKIDKASINQFLYEDSIFLSKNIEYHLLGNHVLENSFSLLYISFFFKNKKLYKQSKLILFEQLDEQILDDGSHFELSTMYHCIILYNLLESINFLNNNNWIQDDVLLDYLKIKAKAMLGWLKLISYKSGKIPLLNDSSQDILRKVYKIFNYARDLDLYFKKSFLSDSGYRRWNQGKVEVLIDVGNIGASYIPGHAHADTFNFEFIYDSKPIIIDPGVSSYDNIKLRIKERSTYMHNTLRINNSDSSEVWGKFRVGNRAEVFNLKESKNHIDASHDGYKNIDTIHNRKFSLNKNRFMINDNLKFEKNNFPIESNLHFHPNCKVKLQHNTIIVDDKILINLVGYSSIEIISYKFPIGFNKTVNSNKIKAIVAKESSIEIKYEN